MKYNPKRIVGAVIVISTILWISTRDFQEQHPGKVKSELGDPRAVQISDKSSMNGAQKPTDSGRALSELSQSSPPSTPVVLETIPLNPIEIKAAIDAFTKWSDDYLATDPEQRAELEKEGIRLAGQRRIAFKQLIQENPRQAIESSLSRVVRQDLPKTITDLLEAPVSSKGNLNVYLGKPAPGMPIPKEGLALRYFKTDIASYRAYVYGDLSSVMSRVGTPLRGVAIDGHFAVAENAVRRLEDGERITKGTLVKDTCPVSKETTTTVAEGEAVTGQTPTVEIGGQYITLCNGSHVTVLEDDYRTYIQSSGPGGGGFFIDNYPGTASRAIGNLRCLYMRVTYPDQMEQPNTEEQAYADMRDNARFFLENSYGKMSQTATVTPVLVLPQTLAWYKAKDEKNGGTIDCLGLIQTDARAVAKAAGYDSAQFDCNIVRINKGPRLEGWSWGGGDSVWITWNGMDVMNHEIGHSLSLNHANYWTSLDGTAYGYGDNEEYGNIFDSMGSGNGFNSHYNTNSKRFLNWLPNSYVHDQVISGTYRLYAYDQPRLEEGKRYALRAKKDVRSYNLEYHPAIGGYLSDGAVVIYTGATSLTGSGTNCGHLIDTTPGSLAGKKDSPITLGSTFSDPEADMHFTVVSKNGTSPESIDVTYNKGPFPGNVAPTATLAASATTVALGGSVTFTATASDSNGDTLAYHWEFNDGESGTNSSVYTRTFLTVGQVTAMLTVSDMKGGTVRRSVVIDVGTHTKQKITGTVTVGGVGLQGVYVSSGTIKGCYTNADGTYSLSGLSTGSNTLSATLDGYTFTPGFTNPLTVVAGTNTANWTAAAGTFVTLSKIADAVEGGANGTFRLTRTGSTASALTVNLAPATGTAVKGTDYSFTPDYATSGSYRTFTIPAGSAALDVTVNAINDTSAEGPETVQLQVATGTGYYSSSTNYQVMTLTDDDTSLPQVSVIATDPYATEAPAGDNGTFKFTRTGATTSSLNLTVAWSGTATNGSDYTTLSTTVTIPSGQSSTNVTLTPTNDTAIEIPETAIVTISASAAYVLDTSAQSATVTLTDDDTPVITVSVPDATASEAGGDTGVLLLTRTGSTAASLKVYYGISGSAAHGTDYARLTGEVTIPAGATSAPVVISPINDDLAEPSEDVTLMIPTFNNAYSVGTANSGTVTILDNGDLPLVNVRADTDGTEGGSNTTFIFHSFGTGTGNITVNYTISGSAISGTDFTALSGSISIPANGSTDTTLTVPITNDTALEPTETIILTITPSTNYRVYNDGSAQGVILDNDSGDRVMVSKFNQTPTESGATGSFYISRTGTTGNLTVNYTMSGTATNGSDYNTLSGSVVIPAGSAGVDLTMTPINDTTAEGTETVTLTILSGTGYGVDIPSSATYAIIDNEAPARTVGFQSTTLSTDELPGILGQFRDLPVILSGSSASTITVDYYGGGGNAAGDNEDWAFVDANNGNAVIRQGTLTFAPGVTSQNIRIRINNDGVGEANETAVIQLARAYNAALVNATSTVTINDTAGQQTVRMLTTATSRLESDGNEPQLQVILDRPAQASISVSYAATGTATSGTDYTLTGTSLSFAIGEQIKAIPLTFLTDALNEAPETIIISLSNPVGATLTSPASHIITLNDSTAPTVASQFVSAASSQSVGTPITTATATLSSGRSVSNWTIVSGNTGNLFTLNASSGQITLTTPAALPNPGGVQLILRVTDNAGASGTGAINVICNAPANAVAEQRWSGTAAYLANDWTKPPTYSGTRATLTSGTNVSNDYSRRLVGFLKPQTTGDYTFWIAGDNECRLYLSTDGFEARKIQIASVVGSTSYQAWDTYDSQKSNPISLVAGKVYWIEAQQYDESGNDSVSVAWSSPSITRVAIPSTVMVATAAGLSFPPPESGSYNNTAPTISNVTDRTTDVGTSTGAIAFTVGDTETPASSLIVSASSSNITLLPQSNIILGGSGANRTITLTPTQEQTGYATVTLTVTDGLKSASDTFLLAVGSSQIVSFQNITGSGAETTSPALIQVTMSSVKATPVTVDFAVTGGTANSGSDYNLTNGTLTFAPGETSKNISLAIINDTVGENNETVEISLGNAVGAMIGTNSTHTYTIVNEDTDFSIVATDNAAAETGPDTGTFTITRSGLTAASVTVNLTRSGTATNSSDYTSIPSTITFASGETVKTITLTPVDDVIIEGSETATITIASGTNYSIGSPASDTITIADNDVDISIAATTPTTAEGGTAGVFTVTRTGITTGTTVVNLTASGTAISATDYTAIAATLTFTAGQTSKTINVSPVNDTAYEDSETVILTVASGTGYQPAAPTSATVTIADNDKPTISVAGTVTAASETGPTNGLITFTRTGWTGISQNINLTITGTAISSADYTALPTTVTFPAGSATTTLTVTPLDDSDFEIAETVIVTIAANAAYTVAGTPNNASTVTITDNDKPTVTVAVTDNICLEQGSNDGVFTLTRTGTLAAALTVNYTLSGAAINGPDYTLRTGIVTFAINGTTATVIIDPIDDTEYEVPEDVTLTITPDPTYIVGTPGSDTLIITDNDKPTVAINTIPTTIFEGDSAPLLTVTRTGVTSLGPLTVLYTVSGTATIGSDYAPLVGSITIPQDQSSASESISILQDYVTEPPETLIVTIATNAAYNIATAPANAANLTILDDNEPAALNIAVTDATASEPTKGDGTGTFTITRSGSTTSSLTVNLLLGGTATEGSDYSTLPTTVTIPSGQTSATINVNPIDDSIAEVDETIILNLLAGNGYTVGTTSTATINLYDDEAAEIRVEVTDAKCLEAATVDPGVITLRRLGNRTSALTVNYTVSGTATSGNDYNALLGSVNLAANGASVTVTVTPINDALVEGTETVILTLAAGTGYTINAQNSGTIEIRDDETVDVNLSVTDSVCAEQTIPDTGAFRITRTATAATPLTVSYTITGTATNGTDYTTLNGTATIAANSTTVDIIVNPINDGILEGSESVIMTLTGAGATYDIGDARTQTIWIKDADTPNITLVATDITAAEADGGTTDQGFWTFTSSFAPSTDLTINYTVTGNNGVDCVFLPGSIVLPAGQTSVTLALVPIDDEIPEAAENIGITLAYGGNYNPTTTSVVNVTITPSDTPIASIGVFDPNAVENPVKTGRYIVALTKVVAANTSVLYTVSGTATSGTDFTALSGSVTVNSGNNSAIITVTPLDDIIADGPESVTLTLIANTGYLVGSPSVATVVIADDEPVASPQAGWKQSQFGVDWNNPLIAGNNIDSDLDGLVNLLEYAFGTNPLANTPSSQGPQSNTSSGSLELTFNRVVANNDITITVQAADDLSGTWTDIASSVNGGVFTPLVAGVTVSENGTGSTRSVSVTDLYTTNNPSHPRRFMRIRVGP